MIHCRILLQNFSGGEFAYDVGSLETDTYAITGEAYAYRTTLVATSTSILLPPPRRRHDT